MIDLLKPARALLAACAIATLPLAAFAIPSSDFPPSPPPAGPLTTIDWIGDCDDCAGAPNTGMVLSHGIGGLVSIFQTGDGLTQPVTGTLTLQFFNEEEGGPFEPYQFVSFEYGGSSILQAFTITQSNVFLAVGFFDPFTGTHDVRIGGEIDLRYSNGESVADPSGLTGELSTVQFSSDGINGNWSINGFQGGAVSDIGTGAAMSFDFAAPVPLPAGLPLLLAGLGGLALMTRRARKAA